MPDDELSRCYWITKYARGFGDPVSTACHVFTISLDMSVVVLCLLSYLDLLGGFSPLTL